MAKLEAMHHHRAGMMGASSDKTEAKMTKTPTPDALTDAPVPSGGALAAQSAPAPDWTATKAQRSYHMNCYTATT